MEANIAVIRDGSANQMPVKDLVEGDCVLLVNGLQVPADIEWLSGDILSVSIVECAPSQL